MREQRKPRRSDFSNSQWKSLTREKQIEIEIDDEERRRQEERDFEAEMRNDQLSTAEITWLRDRIMALETQVLLMKLN